MGKYKLFVGGVEVTDTELSKAEIENLADTYKEDGYKNIEIVEC